VCVVCVYVCVCVCVCVTLKGLDIKIENVWVHGERILWLFVCVFVFVCVCARAPVSLSVRDNGKGGFML
jgi:hypothetical protein